MDRPISIAPMHNGYWQPIAPIPRIAAMHTINLHPMITLPDKYYIGHCKTTKNNGDQRTPKRLGKKEIWRADTDGKR